MGTRRPEQTVIDLEEIIFDVGNFSPDAVSKCVSAESNRGAAQRFRPWTRD